MLIQLKIKIAKCLAKPSQENEKNNYYPLLK